MPALNTLTQTHFRGRNDDGNETTATWFSSLDTNFSLTIAQLNTNFRIRFALESSTTGTCTDQLQYILNGGSATSITTSSNVIRAVTSPNVPNGTATTQQISSGTFVVGEITADGLTATHSYGVTVSTAEDELVFQARSADLVAGDSVVIRTSNTGTPSVTQLTVCTISIVANSSSHNLALLGVGA